MGSKRNPPKGTLKVEDEENENRVAEAAQAVVSSIVSSRAKTKPTSQGTGIPKNKRRRNDASESTLAAAIKEAMDSDLDQVSLSGVLPRGLPTVSRHGRRPTFDDPPLVPEPTCRRNPVRNSRKQTECTPFKRKPTLPTIRSPGNLKKVGNTTECADRLTERFGNMYLAESKRKGKIPSSDFERLTIGKAPPKTGRKGKGKMSSDEDEYDFADDAERGEVASDSSEMEEITVLNEEEKRLQRRILEFTKELPWSKGNLWDVEEKDVQVIREKIDKCKNSPYGEQKEEMRELLAILKRMLEIVELAMRLKEASVDFRTRIQKVGLDWEV